MTISPGSRLGPYEILAPIGAGGMGEVYRAKDPRLGRDVAIKVLPTSFSQDADRLRRFEQEARAAGVLNHPNITAVYDIGTHEGAPYVVQELLEGETLRAALAGAKLPPRKAIDYALQIAHGLAAAHEKGIVHRDLKPENLFVTNDGRVKILDFGLAKLTLNEARPDATSLPTATGATEPGVVLGTLGYMSPEQVKGKPADARSDIFSFGAILYEMLSGRRAFHGDSAAETMSAILREEPPDLSVTNQSVSPGLERIVRHAIEKNPEQRFHSAHDVAFALEALSGLSVPRLEPSSLKVRGRSRSPAAAAAALVLFVQSNARLGFLGLLPGEAKEKDLSGLEWSYGPILSADGKTAVFTEQGEAGGPGYSVYLRKMDGSSPVRLGEGYAMAISPDGKWVLTDLIRSSPTQIVLLPTGAGEPKPFPKDAIEHGSGPFGAFHPDGKRIIFVGHEPGRPSRTFVQDIAGGAARPVTAEGVVARLLSPDGKLLVTQTSEGSALTPLEGGPPRTVAGLEPGDRPLRFTADGRLLYLRSNAREFPARVFRLDLATGRREVWKELMPGDPAGITTLLPSAISEDGKTVLFLYARSLADLYLAQGLK